MSAATGLASLEAINVLCKSYILQQSRIDARILQIPQQSQMQEARVSASQSLIKRPNTLIKVFFTYLECKVELM